MNTSDISNFNGHQLRHVMIDGEPWFVAADVCHCLNIHIQGPRDEANATMACRKLDTDEHALHPIQGKQVRSCRVVSESGLYKLIMRSDKPEAKAFQNWVTKVVLPSIRKTGGYLLNEHARETAHADTKEAMPFPADIMAIFQKQSEQMDRMLGIMEQMLKFAPAATATQVAGPREYTPVFDEAFYEAKDVVLKLKLAGAMPTTTELKAMSVKIGQQLSVMCKTQGKPWKTLKKGQWPARYYPREVIETLVASQP